MDCDGRTVKLYVNTEIFGIRMIAMIVTGFVLLIIWSLLDLFDNMFLDVFIGALILSAIIFGGTFYIYNKQKPILDAARERGRKLYSEHIREYDAGEIIIDHCMPLPATQYPWGIRNIHRLRIALVVTIILTPMPMLLGLFVLRSATSSGTLAISFLTTAFIAVAIFIHIEYSPAKKHYELIKALNLKPDEVKKSFKSLTVKSNIYGNFELKYDSDYGYHLRMALDSDIAKSVPEMDIWTRPNFISKFRNKTANQAIRFQWMNSSQLEAIKSLKQIKVENVFHNKMLFAALDNKALYSETGDIVLVVRLLRETKSNLESEYADRLNK
ncbi:MAG: hypothetical protein KKH41_06045 [Candidatus Thermoplasmatota archaeon]|nr:hypothetical protein [Euryarchaeota archaeon]MBU4031814.1 hypothetical protein [Candidatus Thermoplasmatota archaeon]MBU4072048.1 hypothetical protein [Candidatus Thermoplasmatota archaeon]MBU4144579.1 hypothetical protein [Candidatus Thermoplasmatota archaeon]MBU4592128.1 hypothetical protein [Candidatus Thermoplasmatota archaeon]